MLKLPENVSYILGNLEKSGFEAYAVGGCVRDSLLGLEPGDWDICTNALPLDTKKIFHGEKVIETGIKHGTVTIMPVGTADELYEVTTYRIDGDYSDSRHPDSVTFTGNLADDLARRDFTINAMAYSPGAGIVDPYGGKADLYAKLIRCVGDADKRFGEDALRILRALRFAATYGFTIHDGTAAAMENNKHLLKNVSGERIAIELNKLLLGENLAGLLTAHSKVLFEIIPELEPALGFEQHNKWHCYDVFTHSLTAVDNAPKDLVVRLAMLLHDTGKPHRFTQDDDGTGHFYGHAEVSTEITETVLKRLKYSTSIIKAVTELVKRHDTAMVPKMRSIRRLLNAVGEDRVRQLIEVRKADLSAQSEMGKARIPDLFEVHEKLEEILRQQQCFSLKDLAVNGDDLIRLGIKPGKEIGETLNLLLNKVIDEELENDKEKLMDFVSG